MRFTQWSGLAALAAGALALACTEPAPQLCVVYAGDAGTPHADGYHAMLAEHFDVRSIARNDLAKADLSDADVLIVDGLTIDRSEERIKTIPGAEGVTLETLSMPTVLIGGQGARISDDLNLLLGWRYG
ncbi:MAG: hypothetical protein OXH70_08460 [Acidobacteria bacterium]|nr:hypothetical protein [Acidobacteriota bacterium]